MRTKRIDEIEQSIIEHKSISLDSLCEEFQVSKNTIRRDIDTLVKKGTIKKVYGGVTVSENPPPNELLPYEERHVKYFDEKDKISKAAAEFVEEGDVIYIDTGTTCLNMVDHLSHKSCTIITNSIQVCLKAIPYVNLNLICLPGSLKRETLSFVGNELTGYLSTYNINKAFMACTGITIENGLTNATTEEYTVKKSVIENSHTHFLLADHTKFGHFSLMTYCPLDAIHHVVTDSMPISDYCDYFREHHIALHLGK